MCRGLVLRSLSTTVAYTYPAEREREGEERLEGGREACMTETQQPSIQWGADCLPGAPPTTYTVTHAGLRVHCQLIMEDFTVTDSFVLVRRHRTFPQKCCYGNCNFLVIQSIYSQDAELSLVTMALLSLAMQRL